MPWDPRIQALVDRYPALRAVGNTPLVPVDILRRELPEVEVFSKMESLNPGGSLKDRPVLRMLLGALDDDRLKPGKTVLDSSSGNAGIAYAMIGRIIGAPVEIVIPDNASAERKKRMLAHGAHLVFTDALLGYDEALREVRRRWEADPDRYFFCDQYSNPDNWRAHYETTVMRSLLMPCATRWFMAAFARRSPPVFVARPPPLQCTRARSTPRLPETIESLRDSCSVCEIVARCLGILASRRSSTATPHCGPWATPRSSR